MADVADSTGWLNPEMDQILRWKAREPNRSNRCKPCLKPGSRGTPDGDRAW